ncbi:MAG: helix-turn-helix transcriptional regulator [Planctomycetota bacterium]|nr:helix-turn-helix transcriptional regulator [Planctomycetota bacterium]
MKIVEVSSAGSLHMAVEVAAGFSSLPAVATQDWCSRAASSLKGIRPHAIAAVSLACVGSRGSILQFEASGATGSDPFGRAIESEMLHPEHASSFDWWLGEDGVVRQQCEVGIISELPCRDRWLESAAGRRWAKLGVTDLLVGVGPIAGGQVGRCVVIEVGSASGAAATSDQLEIVRAVLPLLVRRAALAFGVERSTALTRLTHREQQVLEHLALGKSVKQIAVDLARSPHTVHDHVKSLHRKLNASSRGELIARALGHLATGGRRARVSAAREEYELSSGSNRPALMSA